MIILSTNVGDITIELFADKAPVSVKNFLAYVDAGFYDGTIFHRVIPDFMVQCGGFTPDMVQKQTNAPIKNEADNGLSNEPYTVAMARTDNPDSATAQFYINLKDNKALNKATGRDGYAVFGKVIEGLDVVDKIADVETATRGPHEAVPVKDVVIKSVRRAEKK